MKLDHISKFVMCACLPCYILLEICLIMIKISSLNHCCLALLLVHISGASFGLSWGYLSFKTQREICPPKVFLLVWKSLSNLTRKWWEGQTSATCWDFNSSSNPGKVAEKKRGVLKDAWGIGSASSQRLYLHIVSFVPHPSLIGVLCLTASLDKQYNHSSPVLIPSSSLSWLSWSIALSNYPSRAGEWSNCLECNYSGSLKGGHCVELRLQFSEQLCLCCKR